jgi:hypothetical protein
MIQAFERLGLRQISEVPVECSWRIPEHARPVVWVEEDSAVPPCGLLTLLKSAGPAGRT